MPHIHERYDYTVGCFIVYAGKVLLVNHPRYGIWLCPGGHIELDENPEEALFREVKEETGLEVTILSDRPVPPEDDAATILQPAYVDIHYAQRPHQHINFTYFATAKTDQAVLSSEHTEFKWFSRDELHDPRYKLTPRIIFFAEAALKAADKVDKAG